MKQANEIRTQFEIKLDDDKVINVCKRTILAAINKIIVGEVFLTLYYNDHNFIIIKCMIVLF